MIPASESVSCFPGEKPAAMLHEGDEVDSFSCGQVIKMKVLAVSHANNSSWTTLHTRDGSVRLCHGSKVLIPLDGKLIERRTEEVTVGTRLLRLFEGIVLVSKVSAISYEFMSPEPSVCVKAKLRRLFVGGVLCKV